MEVDTIQLKEDFLRYFEMPTLSDISEEHEPETISMAAESVTAITQDNGQFINPLTDDLSSSSTSSEHDSLLGFEDQDDIFAVDSLHSDSEISDMADIPSDDAPRKITFQGIPKEFATIEGDEEDANEAVKRIVMASTIVEEFVDYLLTKIVTAYENRLSENKLRSKCDKMKLVTELRTIIDEYIYEKYTNEMLNTRLIEYYKRSRNNRVLVRLDEEIEHQYYERYIQALAKVDHLKLCLQAVKYKHAALMVKVNLDLDSAQYFGSNVESKLERKIQKLLVRPDSDFLKRYVDWALRQMNAKRNEISDMRLGLISKMNTLGQLRAKLQELETVSSTVSIQDFISIQNDVINLEKKVEERNLDLNKMRTQYLMEVHVTHHNREKAHALADKLKHMKATLANAIGRQRSLRAILYDLKLDRTKIREKRKELTFQGGILAMPSLMYEYDNTVMQTKASQERVAKLRETVKWLVRRISIAEGGGRSC
ncbi:hypothetical protein KR032_008757 [Drosophila birchii]|nr:hypothetical protein KR032_008757 [Drosophila birchii]